MGWLITFGSFDLVAAFKEPIFLGLATFACFIGLLFSVFPSDSDY
jgi:hypothetical protein